MDFRGKRIFFNIVGAILTILLFVASFFALVNVVFNVCYIKTDVYQLSMYPTLNAGVANNEESGDKVYINRFAPVSRGDIVVAQVKWNEQPIIKRLVACPNDSFYILDAGENYELYVNEQLFYAMPKTITYSQNNETGSTAGHYKAFIDLVEIFKANGDYDRVVKSESGQEMLKLLDDEYLLLGDNWAASEDSLTAMDKGLTGEFAKKSEFIGKVDIIIHQGENKYASLFKQMSEMIFSIY